MDARYPSIDEVRRIAKRDGLRRCVVVFQLQDGRVGYTSYGETRALCQSTRQAMDAVFDDIEKRMQTDLSTKHPQLF